MCDSFYNCYQTSERYVANFTPQFVLSLTSENPKLENILTTFKNRYVTNSNLKEAIFKIVIKMNGNFHPRILCFNHSFIVNKKQDNYELCDSWAGIHSFRCRKKDFIKWFDELIVDLSSYSVSDELIEFFREPYDIPIGEWKNEYPCPITGVPKFNLKIAVYY